MVFVFRRSRKMTKICEMCVCVCATVLDIKYNRNIENCTAKSKVNLKPFSVFVSFHTWWFFGDFFKVMLLLLKLIPRLPFAIQNNFARHSVNTHVNVYVSCVYLNNCGAKIHYKCTMWILLFICWFFLHSPSSLVLREKLETSSIRKVFIHI